MAARPADYTIGSPQSRAAARALLEGRQGSCVRRDVILSVDAESHPMPSASAWTQDPKDRSMGRLVCIPEGMTIADGLRVVGGYSAQELDQIAIERPEQLQCGGLFSLER